MSIYTRNWQHIVLSMIRTIHRPIPLWHVVPLWSQLYCKCYPKEDTELANFDDYIGQFSGLRCCWRAIDLPGPRLNDLPRKHIIKTTFVALLHWKMALITLSNAELWWIQKLKMEICFAGTSGVSVVTWRDCLSACVSLGTVAFAGRRAQMAGAYGSVEVRLHVT